MSLEQKGSQILVPTEPLSALDDLKGLPIAEAFRKHVLEHQEVAELGRKIAKTRPSSSAVFLEGQYPGPFVNFHWPLHATSESIAHAFVSQPIVFLGDALPVPSQPEAAVSRRLAERLASFVGLLARGDLIAVGTAVATGLETPIGRGQWARQDLLLDVKNSAICEIKDNSPTAAWTGVWLMPSTLPPANIATPVLQSRLEEPSKARKQIQTKQTSRRQCEAWLGALMSDPQVKPRTNEQLWAEAKSKWPGSLSEREFARCRAAALGSLNEEQRYLWGRPGPRRKQT